MATNTSSAQGTLQRSAAPAQTGTTFRERTLTPRMRGIIIRQIFLQIFLLTMLVIVMFPVMWIVSMAIDPRGITRPTDLNLFPPNANLDAFQRLLTEPFSNVLPLYFGELMMNSLFIALGTSLFTVILGSSAAYAFSRFRFIGRQGGMLAFIILLLLPATGVVIPLYVMFSSIQVNSGLAAAIPSFFSGAFIAILVYVAYTLVRNFGRKDPDRSINISPQLLSGIVAAITLVALAITFFVIFQRSPLYSAVIDQPVRAIGAEYVEAKEDYDQRVQSLAQRDLTATRREERAASEADMLAALIEIQNQVGGLSEREALEAIIEREIAERQAGAEPDDDLVLQALLTGQPILETGGVAGFMTTLEGQIALMEEQLAENRREAEVARTNAEEQRLNVAAAETRLLEAERAFDQDAGAIYAIRDQAFVQVLPTVILVWLGTLAAAFGVWALIRLLKHDEPQTIINLMMYAVVLALTIGLGITTLQDRMDGLSRSSETLRTTLIGLSLAFASGGLPFAIWNLKGYFDTIPKELEEAALIDGAGLVGTFIRVMIPLALPAFAIVILFSFMQGWTEFILSWIFLTGETQNYTLAMALATMANGANQAPPDMQKFAAMSILISIPIIILFFAFQRWIVGGLAIGGVKG